MKWTVARAIVEELREETKLYLPPLTSRRGFSSSRIEHLLNRMVEAMPLDESYFEVGVLEGRTLDAAAAGNIKHTLIGCDPCNKYHTKPRDLEHVTFLPMKWEEALSETKLPIGIAFYDGDHSSQATARFMYHVRERMADEAILILDDWDRVSVRAGAFDRWTDWQLLAEMPEYTDGLTCPPNHFGYYFGVSVWGYRR